VIGSFTSIGSDVVPLATGSNVSLEIEVEASTEDPVAVSPLVIRLLVEIGPFTDRFVNVAFVPVMLVVFIVFAVTLFNVLVPVIVRFGSVVRSIVVVAPASFMYEIVPDAATLFCKYVSIFMLATEICFTSPVIGSIVSTVFADVVDVGVGFRVSVPSTVRSVIVAVFEVRVLFMIFARLAVPVAVMFVPVAFVKNRFCIYPVRAESIDEKKFVDVALVKIVLVPVAFVQVMFVGFMFPADRFVIVAFVAVRLFVFVVVAFIVSAVVVPVRDRLFSLDIVVVEVTPFTVEVRELFVSPV
jgi:hypothetical protein